MRVCMVAYTFYEGDNRVRRYAESLKRRGDQVDAIVLRQDGAASFAQVSGVNVYKIQKRALDEKKKMDYLVKLLLFLVRSAVLLARLQFKKGYDLVHVHSVPDFEVFAALVPKLFGAKVVLDIHDIVPELFASKFGAKQGSLLFRMLVLMERLSMAFSDHVIVANHIWHERLVVRSVPPRKCSVVMNYPDPHIFIRKANMRRVRGKHYVIVYPGTLSIHQGLETAIRAVHKLKEQIPELQFHIYGKGTDESYFVSLVRDLGLEDRVFFRGIVPIEKLPEVIEQADLGVEPKLSRTFGNEAFSTKILEFMAMGVPVVASDTLVHSRYFDETLLQFFRSEDVDDLSSKILRVRNDVQLRERMVNNALKFMQENNWEAKKHLYHALVDSLVKGE